MKRFVEGAYRDQSTLFPECLEDWVDANNPVRVIAVFVDTLDLADLGFAGVNPRSTGRPSYHPAVLLTLYVYGYRETRQVSRDCGRVAARTMLVNAIYD
jgi:transposase